MESRNEISNLAPLVTKWVSPLVVHNEPQMVSNGLLMLNLVKLPECLPHDCDQHVQEMDQKEE